MLVRHSLPLCSIKTLLVAAPFLTCALFFLVSWECMSTPFHSPELVILLNVHVPFHASVRGRKHPNGSNASNRRERRRRELGRSPPPKKNHRPDLQTGPDPLRTNCIFRIRY